MLEPRRWCETMHLGGVAIAQMNHVEAESGQYISDDTAMTAPPEQLGAHYGNAESAGKRHELSQAKRKLFCRDVVGVTTKGGMTPASVDRRGAGAAASTKLRYPSIVYAGTSELAPQRVSVEVRRVSRAGKPTDIHDQLDAMLGQNALERRGCACGMTDSPDARLHALSCGRRQSFRSRRDGCPRGAHPAWNPCRRCATSDVSQPSGQLRPRGDEWRHGPSSLRGVFARF